MARTQQFPLRYNDEERARWQAAADRAGLSLSEWIRAACDVAAILPPDPMEMSDEAAAIHRKWHTPVEPSEQTRAEVSRFVDGVVDAIEAKCQHKRKSKGASGLTRCLDCGKVNP
jgi:hypothetical protein